MTLLVMAWSKVSPNLIEIEFDLSDNESRPNRFESQPDWDYGIL